MRRPFAALLLAALASAGLAAPVPKGGKEPVYSAYYPLKPGARWEYVVGGSTTMTMAVTGITKRDGAKVATVETRVNDKTVATERVASSDKGVFREAINTNDVTPPVQFLRSPVTPGDKWDVKARTGAQGIDVTFTVREAEEVTVPAGKYKTVRIDCTGDIGGTKTDATYWFAADVGVVKLKYTIAGNDAVLELKTFTPGKD